MGTRAQFFLGNPEDVNHRRWLGCTAYDGYCHGWTDPLADAVSEEDFARIVKEIAGPRKDFCDPDKHGFPFPWINDLFLTDYTYAWFGGKPMVTCYHRGWIGHSEYLNGTEADQQAYHSGGNTLARDVPAPTKEWDRSGPDSIMFLRLG